LTKQQVDVKTLSKQNVAKMENWQNGKLAKQQAEQTSWRKAKFACWQNNKLMEWQVDKTTSWCTNKSSKQQVDEMTIWRIDEAPTKKCFLAFNDNLLFGRFFKKKVGILFHCAKKYHQIPSIINMPFILSRPDAI
jgi:hypothetical protein